MNIVTRNVVPSCTKRPEAETNPAPWSHFAYNNAAATLQPDLQVVHKINCSPQIFSRQIPPNKMFTKENTFSQVEATWENRTKRNQNKLVRPMSECGNVAQSSATLVRQSMSECGNVAQSSATLVRQSMSECGNVAQSSATLVRQSRPVTARERHLVHRTTINNMSFNSPDLAQGTVNTKHLIQQVSHEELSHFATTRPGTTVTVRPITASYLTNNTERLVVERLRAMYSKRRAASATAHATFTSQLQPEVDNSSFNYSESQSDSSNQELILHTSFPHLGPLAKFKMMASLTIYVQRLMTAIVKSCNDNTMRSANELQWLTVYAEKNDATLAFNKHLYSRDRVSTHVPDWALSILDLRPEDRSEQDCRRLHALLRGMKSFDKFTGEIQMFLCRACTLERVAEGRVVLKSGHVGLNFYLIYSGSVFVNVEDFTRGGRKFMRTVAVLTRGESFGELALLQNIKRTATVSVRERCELLAVDKTVFASVCPRIFEKELAKKYAFLSSLDLFSTKYWSPESIRSLAMNAQLQEYKINKVIVADSSVEDWIYICMERYSCVSDQIFHLLPYDSRRYHLQLLNSLSDQIFHLLPYDSRRYHLQLGRCQVVRCLSLDKPISDGDPNRKMSDVVLSEEILELLSAGAVKHETRVSHKDEDMKENLLTSLGLDYVPTKQKLYQSSDPSRKNILNMNETLTLTTYVKRYLENSVKDFVILSLGAVETRQVFDLQSLLDNGIPSMKTSNILMLVSCGAKVVRVKKAAFFDQVSQQAMDNTRTLASKRRNPSDDTVLESYKCKIAWDEFKSSLVHDILTRKKSRYQPIFRTNLTSAGGGVSRQNEDSSHTKHSKIISALQRNRAHDIKAAISFWSSSDESSNDETVNEHDVISRPKRSASAIVQGNNYFEELEPSSRQEKIIIRRHLAKYRNRTKIIKTKDKLARIPKYLL